MLKIHVASPSFGDVAGQHCNFERARASDTGIRNAIDLENDAVPGTCSDA